MSKQQLMERRRLSGNRIFVAKWNFCMHFLRVFCCGDWLLYMEQFRVCIAGERWIVVSPQFCSRYWIAAVVHIIRFAAFEHHAKLMKMLNAWDMYSTSFARVFSCGKLWLSPINRATGRQTQTDWPIFEQCACTLPIFSIEHDSSVGLLTISKLLVSTHFCFLLLCRTCFGRTSLWYTRSPKYIVKHAFL